MNEHWRDCFPGSVSGRVPGVESESGIELSCFAGRLVPLTEFGLVRALLAPTTAETRPGSRLMLRVPETLPAEPSNNPRPLSARRVVSKGPQIEFYEEALEVHVVPKPRV